MILPYFNLRMHPNTALFCAACLPAMSTACTRQHRRRYTVPQSSGYAF
jgi:hypothetical protein